MPTLSFGPCSRRAVHLEHIERPDISDDELADALDFNEFLNRWLGGHGIVTSCFSSWSSHWMAGQTLSVLDMGCGRGDLSRALAGWARSRKVEMKILGVDRSPRIIEMARLKYKDIPEIIFECRELSDPLFLQAQQFDYVVSAQAIHMRSAADAALFIKKANLLARRGFVISDWVRDIRSWLWMKVFTSFTRNEILLHDGPLAIRKGFTLKEVERLVTEAGCDYAKVSKHLGYRFSIAGERGLVMSPKLAAIPGLLRT